MMACPSDILNPLDSSTPIKARHHLPTRMSILRERALHSGKSYLSKRVLEG